MKSMTKPARTNFLMLMALTSITAGDIGGQLANATGGDLRCKVARDYVDIKTINAKPGNVVFFEDRSDISVISCSSVRSLLRKRNIAYGRSAVDKITNVPGRNPYKSVILSASMPVISKNGREAVLQTGEQFAPLGGYGKTTTMRRTGTGRWIIVRQSPTWIS